MPWPAINPRGPLPCEDRCQVYHVPYLLREVTGSARSTMISSNTLSVMRSEFSCRGGAGWVDEVG